MINRVASLEKKGVYNFTAIVCSIRIYSIISKGYQKIEQGIISKPAQQPAFKSSKRLAR